MNLKEEIIQKLKTLTVHPCIEILTRGNSAIFSALHAVKHELLVPEEGGWLTYLQYPGKLKLKLTKVKTNNAVLDLNDLKQKTKTANALLYQNPGGYHAEQPMQEVYSICKKNNCLVILDVSGGIGTRLCNGDYADIIIGSFGRWKLVEAKVGGFISCKDEKIFNKIKPSFKTLGIPSRLLTGGIPVCSKTHRLYGMAGETPSSMPPVYSRVVFDILDDENKLKTILEKMNNLQKRISFLGEKRKRILADLKDFNIVNRDHLGFVLIIKYQDDLEKEKLINYCENNHLVYTECPRYIRINQKGISIEVKQLEE